LDMGTAYEIYSHRYVGCPSRTGAKEIGRQARNRHIFRSGLNCARSVAVQSEATQLGMMPAKTVAKLLLSELARGHKA
jgi:hypothetical protein